jgi:glycosyltransferase involved in cell wall biosynthesis
MVTTDLTVGQAEVLPAPRCSVVVCTRGGPDVERCLEALTRLDHDSYEVIVVDNTDGALDVQRSAERFGCRYVVEPVVGLSVARNTGAEVARGDIVAFVDDDAVADPQWLAQHEAAFVDPMVAGTTGRIVPFSDESVDGTDLDRWLDLGPTSFRVDRSTPAWFERANFGGVGGGANLAFRRSLFLAGWGFRPALGRPWSILGEEHFALYALIRDGYTIEYVAGAMVHHGVRRVAEIEQDPTEFVRGVAAYSVMLLVEERGHRRDVIAYGAGALRGRRRTWRVRGGAGHRFVTRRDMVRAVLAGPLLYLRWRRATARSARQRLMVEPSTPSAVHVLGTASPAGTAQAEMVLRLAQHVAAEGWRIRAWSVGGDGPLLDLLRTAGLPAASVPMRGWSDVVGAVRFARALRRERPTIVHFHTGGRARIVVTRLFSTARVISHVHGTHDDAGRPLRLAPLVPVSDALIAVSADVNEALGGSATVVAPGVDVPAQAVEHAATETPVVGTVARLEPVKGLHTVIDAIAHVRDAHPGVRLEIAGTGRDEGELQAYAEARGVGDAVRFLGWTDDLGARHHTWDIYVQPSMHEGFGVSVVEAMASGLPVVVSATGGLRDVVVDGITGRSVRPGDVRALADVITELAGSVDARARLGEAARSRVRRDFTPERAAAETLAIYRKLCVAPPVPRRRALANVVRAAVSTDRP